MDPPFRFSGSVKRPTTEDTEIMLFQQGKK
jgi:hypothetical protein